MNLQNEDLTLDMRNIPGFEDQTTFHTYSVSAEAATDVLADEWTSPMFNHTTGDVDSQFMTIPPLSMSIVAPGPPSGPTSVEGAVSELSFKLFPNPSDGIVQLEFRELPASMHITDMTGRMIEQWSAQDWGTHQQLDLRHLTQGTYFLSAERSGITSTQRITLNH